MFAFAHDNVTALPQKRDRRSQHLRAIHSSETVEWYTPLRYVEAARRVMGKIDLDPASNEFANQVVKAERYYTEKENGLAQEWHGKVWCNPPYGLIHSKSSQGTWVRKLIESYRTGVTIEAILLVSAVPEKKWFQVLYDHPICFTDHRIHFYNERIIGAQPALGSTFIYFGKNTQKFIDIFSQFGSVLLRISKPRQTVQPLSLWEVS